MGLKKMAKMLIIIGLALIILGLIIFFASILASKFDIKIPLGKLPGDIKIQNGNFSFYFPITTSIIVSIVLSFLLWIFTHFTK